MPRRIMPRSPRSLSGALAATCVALAACADGATAPQTSPGLTHEPSAARQPRTVPTVHIVYLVPADRTVSRTYVRALEATAINLQAWYQEQLGGSETYRLTKPVVEVIQTTHDAEWYATNETEGDPVLQYWDNTLADAFLLTGGGFNQDGDLWVYYLDAAQACGQVTGATSGVAVMPRNELIGLAGETTTDSCTGERFVWGSCFWVGVLGHELGHALGLPHPASCEAQSPDCPYFALMWRGFERYPDTWLLPSDLEALADSPFLIPTRLRGRIPSCADIAPTAMTLASASSGDAAPNVKAAIARVAGAPTRACAFGRFATLPVLAGQ